MAAVSSADTRVVVMRMADWLHNMRTLQFLPQAKQLRKARDVLDVFVPVAQQLSMDTVGSELETLAFAALVRSRPARRLITGPSSRWTSSVPLAADPVKAEFRTMLYELFDTALRAAGIYPRQRDQFVDRGDGLLALIHEVGQASRALLVTGWSPSSRFLASYNVSLPPQRQLRVRVVAHEGKVHYDANGCFGRRWM